MQKMHRRWPDDKAVGILKSSGLISFGPETLDGIGGRGFLRFSKKLFYYSSDKFLKRIKNISQREGRPKHYTNDEFKIRKKYKWFLICKKVIEELE